ncbi:hypothetical protein [Bacteroides sp. 51]|uniref:hypothetical protein n=1 Tax=Bacteroides sp. 51 TaxID=2302938 RepID=UPI0013D48620|nr:hypothetical protein [Bacteroides sp. 51]NDV83540.1 hypothetical protein [Bacteroides sp. 51]
MKAKLLLFIVFSLTFTSIYCQQVKRATCIDGIWGEWKEQYGVMVIEDAGLIIYSKHNHPSDYVFRLQLLNYQGKANKKDRKRKIKNEQFYEYQGTVELFTFYEDANTNESAKNFTEQSLGHTASKKEAAKKITLPATIKIQPRRKGSDIYYIFFDSFGMAVGYF